MKEKNNHYQDLTYKFYLKTLKIKFHNYLGYDGEELKFTNTEIIPLPNYEKRKDISYIIDGKTSYNIEFQSSAVYNDKMITIYKYHIYDETETGLPVKNIIFSTSNPNHGIKYIYIDYGIIFIPDFFFTKEKDGKEILNKIEYKIKNNIELTDNDAIDLLILPDMDIDVDNIELIGKICTLINKANIPDENFKNSIKRCARKMIRRFIDKKNWEAYENMLNLKATDYGLEPGTTGFEEAIELSYLDGEKEGKIEGIKEGKIEGIKEGKIEEKIKIAKKLIQNQFDDKTIHKITELPQEKIEKIKKEITK